MIKQAKMNQHLILYSRFKKVENVIPLGYSAESALLQFLNQNCIQTEKESLLTRHLDVIL